MDGIRLNPRDLLVIAATADLGSIDGALRRSGRFDRVVERGGVKKALSGSNLDASDIIGKIVYYTLVLFVLQFAFGVFGPNPVSDLLAGIIAFLPKIIVAIVIVIPIHDPDRNFVIFTDIGS